MYNISPVDFPRLFESVPGLYLILLSDFTIVAASNSYLKATMTERDKILGRNLFDVFPDNPDDKEATGEVNLRASLNYVLQHKTVHTMAIQKYDIRKPDGTFEERYWSPLNKPVLNDDGSLLYIIHRVEDATEFVRLKEKEAKHKKATEQLKMKVNDQELEIFQRAQEIQKINQQLLIEIGERRSAETQVQVLNKDLEAFTYSVAHDLRAPLRIIDGYSTILSEEYFECLNDEGKRITRVIGANVHRMGRLIDDLLNFSRLGKLSINRKLTDLNQILNDVVREQLSLVARDRVDLTSGTLEPANCDINLMRHVLSNLFSNAIKYSSKKEKSIIEIGSHREGGEVIYFIKDNGSGFDMKYVDKLFGVFQRLHHTTEFEGTGVGLAIVRRIVDMHGGKVWADATPDLGATFYFSLKDQ